MICEFYIVKLKYHNSSTNYCSRSTDFRVMCEFRKKIKGENIDKRLGSIRSGIFRTEKPVFSEARCIVRSFNSRSLYVHHFLQKEFAICEIYEALRIF